MAQKIWRDGWWPEDPEVEQYLKDRILIAEPTATFFYAPEFLAERERKRKEKCIVSADGFVDGPSERPLLRHIEQTQKGPMFLKFLDAAKRGIKDPKDVVAHVVRTLQKYNNSPAPERLALILAHPEEAEMLADEAIVHVQTPPEVRRHNKELRDSEYRGEAMHSNPPSDRQLGYLRKLGCKETPETMQEASRLIQQFVSK